MGSKVQGSEVKRFKVHRKPEGLRGKSLYKDIVRDYTRIGH
jgi:hypothetical protein